MRTLPSSLQQKLAKSMQTVYNDADPRMEVAVARARDAVVDAEYWTVETIRKGLSLADISVAARRYAAHGRPNRLYEIHIDAGTVWTALREYPDRLKDGWINQFSLGPGISVAIVFDGVWERYRTLWRLVTHEEPWVAWVNDSNELYVQLWSDASSKLQLATSVTDVTAIRGWKNTEVPYKDQGIVVAYIKTDGSVYYRSYCEDVTGTQLWEVERQLTEFTGTAVSLNLFRLNDYRLGFVVEDDAGVITWYISSRLWAGMTLPTETFMNPPAITDKSLTLFEMEHIEVDQPAEIFDSPPVLDNVYVSCGTDADFATIVSVTAAAVRSDKYSFFIEFSTDVIIPNLTSFLASGITTEYTMTNAVVTGNKLVVTTAEELSEFGFSVTVNDNYLLARITDHCVLKITGIGLVVLDGILATTEETFNSPPVLVDSTLTQKVMSYESYADQPAETFNSPPIITDKTLTQLYVGLDPL